MKVSYQWLRAFVEIDLLPHELAERLSMVGLEVEGISEIGQGYDRIVVGNIQEIQEIPEGGALKLCRVDSGQGLLNIVCGAPNVSPGDKVPLALSGAVLENGLEVQPAKIKGQWSEGMICSSAELGLGEEDGGALILSREARVGQSIADALDLKDTVLELSITPNRPDCLSILGVAREIGAITGKPLTKGTLDCLEADPPIAEMTSVTIQAPELCPRYTARLILGVKVGPSPLWLQKKLRAIGLRPINNVVDVTNYVLFELGQPLHAFDFDFLEERRILVRRANLGESFMGLDGVTRSLDPEMLVIADSNKAVALGGVIGGWSSQVTLETRNILLESAYFDPRSIRRTSRRLGLQTEASYRFERGTDPEGVVLALDRAADLIRQLAGGKLARGVIDCYERPIPRREIALRLTRLNKVMGIEISSEEAASILRRLELEVSETLVGQASSLSNRQDAGSTLKAEVPGFRHDLTREIDLIEEVARHYGYHRIPSTLPSGSPPLPPPWAGGLGGAKPGKEQALERWVRGWMQGYGVSEVITYSFISEEALEGLKVPESHPFRRALILRNPLSQEWKILRNTLLPGLLQVIALNLKRKVRGLRIFEMGRVFWPLPGKELPQEKRRLAGATTGNTASPLWDKNKEEGFFILKGVLEGLFQELHLPSRNFRPSSEPYLHPYRSAQIEIEGQILGHLGELHPAVAAAFGLTRRVYVFEIDYDRIALLSKREVTFVPLPKHPAVYRDLAVVVENQVTCQQVEETILRTGSPILRQAKVFDVYAGDPIPSGKKSLAYSLTFQAEDRTLTYEEVHEIYEEIVTALERNWGGKMRE